MGTFMGTLKPLFPLRLFVALRGERNRNTIGVSISRHATPRNATRSHNGNKALRFVHTGVKVAVDFLSPAPCWRQKVDSDLDAIADRTLVHY